MVHIHAHIKESQPPNQSYESNLNPDTTSSNASCNLNSDLSPDNPYDYRLIALRKQKKRIH